MRYATVYPKTMFWCMVIMMNLQKTIYRNYDIRGSYPSEINEQEVEKIGHSLVSLLGLKIIAIGRDIRPSGASLFDALTCGITKAGGDVVDLGIVTTPMTYFACDDTVDASVMITASHMGSTFNGLKMCFSGGIPFPATILKEIEAYVRENIPFESIERGTVTSRQVKEEWIKFFTKRFNFEGERLHIVVDPANMVGVLEIDTLKAFEPELTVDSIYDTFDHTTPNHEANPLVYESLHDLGKEVVLKNAHLGVALDGDADRIGFVDENGTPVASDLIGVLISKYLLARYPNETIVYDLRSTKSAEHHIEKFGGTPKESPVGHINVRSLMREHNAIFGAEVSGHFFFRDMQYSEGGILPVLIILDILRLTKQSLSELVAEVRMYHKSEEVNTEVTRSPEQIYAVLTERYSDGAVSTLDGLKIVYETWWFNVRPSANDPVIRLNLEADTKELLEIKLAEVLSHIVY